MVFLPQNFSHTGFLPPRIAPTVFQPDGIPPRQNCSHTVLLPNNIPPKRYTSWTGYLSQYSPWIGYLQRYSYHMGFLPHRIPPTVFLPHGIPPMVFLLNGIPPLPHLFFSIFFWGVSLSYQSFIRWWEPHLPNFFLIFRRCKSPLTIFFSSFLWGVGFLHQIFFLQVFGGVSGGSLLTNLIFNFFTFFWVVGASAPNYFFLQFFEGCKFPPHIFFFLQFFGGV